ncbi:MAG: RNA methyltransferase [Acidobacteriota bacterium]|nr:RNA methyltransferase [Blastocatellia bacterium]MDW8239761.1 RNA methyltransferase [Acidobacteriota bacterium]
MPIFSRHNPLVKRYRQVRVGVDRHSFFLEGIRLIEDALRSRITLDSVMVARDLLTNPAVAKLVGELTRQGIRCEVTSWEIQEYLSDVQTPQGIVAIAPRRQWSIEELFERMCGPALLMVVEGWRDPGNLGTMLRAGEALGLHGVITTPHTVDPFSPKVMRASMGSALRVPVIDRIRLHAVLPSLEQRGLQILAATVQRGETITTVDLTKPTAVLVGNEATGLSQEAVALSHQIISIPMKASVASLNAAMSATIILYEAARQRGFAVSE